jgi:hypothetical protein
MATLHLTGSLRHFPYERGPFVSGASREDTEVLVNAFYLSGVFAAALLYQEDEGCCRVSIRTRDH